MISSEKAPDYKAACEAVCDLLSDADAFGRGITSSEVLEAMRAALGEEAGE